MLMSLLASVLEPSWASSFELGSRDPVSRVGRGHIGRRDSPVTELSVSSTGISGFRRCCKSFS